MLPSDVDVDLNSNEAISMGEVDAADSGTAPQTTDVVEWERPGRRPRGNGPSTTSMYFDEALGRRGTHIASARPPVLRRWNDTVAMFSNGTGGELGVAGLMIWPASVIFGGIHFFAWPATMPTRTEQILWRFSAIYFTTLPVGILLFAVVGAIALSILPKLGRGAVTFVLMPLVLVLGWTIMAYPVIRAIVIFDSLALLRQLPDTAYRDLSWSDVIPSL